MRDDIVVCASSYQNPHGVTVLDMYPHTLLYVCESEEEMYRKAYPHAMLRVLPKGVQGNMARVKNTMLDDFAGKVVCILADDVSSMGYIEAGETHILATLDDFLLKFTVLASDAGCHLWGIHFTSYGEYVPFSFTRVPRSNFLVHVHSPLRYDEEVPLDSDICLQHFQHYRKVLTLQKYFCKADEEAVTSQPLQKKWGTAIVKDMTIRVPIKGV